MLFKYRCIQTIPTKAGVESHFDMPGAGNRPLVLTLPAPGPKCGEVYDIEITGVGVAPSAPVPEKPKQKG